MPYKDHEVHLAHLRDNARTRRYGNWRQIYVDCGGMCTGILEDGSVCGELEDLEFHEEFGKDGFKLTRLYCLQCHQKVHGESITLNPRHYRSRLQEDVQREIQECGSYEAWKSKYHLIDKGES